jgi:hypothetical protein
MGANAKSGHAVDHHVDKKSAEKKKKTTITAASVDHEVADKSGEFFEDTFLPAMKKLVEAGLSHAEVKRRVKIPATRGAKLSGQQFKELAVL